MWDVKYQGGFHLGYYLRGCHLGCYLEGCHPRCCHFGHTVCVGWSSGILSSGMYCTVSVGLSSGMSSWRLSSRMLTRGVSPGLLSCGMYVYSIYGLSSGMLYRWLSSGMLSCGTYSICGVVIWYVI